MKSPLVIYHADCIDGFGGAVAAWLRYGSDAEYFAAHHGHCKTRADIDEHLPLIDGRLVYILDFSFPPDVMLALMERAESVIWLDHHTTSFDNWCGPDFQDQTEYFCQVIAQKRPTGTSRHVIQLDSRHSGAMLAWRYFNPGKPIPRLYAHVSDYDLVKFALPHTREFILALNSTAPYSFQQWCLLNERLGNMDSQETESYRHMVREGEALRRLQQVTINSIVQDAILCQLPGHPDMGLAVTCPMLLANDVGAALVARSGTYAVCWHMLNSGAVKCSLRSDGAVDVSALAELQGGGGSRMSAGLRTDLPTLSGWLR